MNYSKGLTGLKEGTPGHIQCLVHRSRALEPSWVQVAGTWIGVRVDKADPQWQGAEPWTCWNWKAGTLGKLTRMAVLTERSMGRGAVEQSETLGLDCLQVDPKSRFHNRGLLRWYKYNP